MTVPERSLLVNNRIILGSNSSHWYCLKFSLQDLRALTLLLSVHTPKQLNAALIPTLQELLNKCRTCQQQKNSLQEQEAKERKTKGLFCPNQGWS